MGYRWGCVAARIESRGRQTLEVEKQHWQPGNRGIGPYCKNSHGSFRVWEYKPASKRGNCPYLIFIHGGGFAAGDTATVENQCKLIAQMADGVVLSVDYPLAPENKHPAALDACYDTVVWAWENAGELELWHSQVMERAVSLALDMNVQNEIQNYLLTEGIRSSRRSEAFCIIA